MRFVDTNVLLYAISTEPSEASKATVATQVLAERNLSLSAQVLQEFYVQATREGRANALTHDQATSLVISFLRFSVVETTKELVVAAMSTRQRWGISYWDAAIIEAARHAGCDVVLSEDLTDGESYGGVRVENPFSVAVRRPAQ